MDLIALMTMQSSPNHKSRRSTYPEHVFGEIGEVAPVLDAYFVRTPEGATLKLAPNADLTVVHGVHIDEISVPPPIRQQGIASKAMKVLCKLADVHGFVLEGGPVGFSDDPSSEQFVCWLRSLGFERDPSPKLIVPHDSSAFCVRRIPRRTA